MTDIVVDTCTLVHANNDESPYQLSSIELISKLLMNNTLLTVDEGFDTNETTNASYIGLEYLKHLTPGMLGYTLIQQVAQNQRFNFVSNAIQQADKHYIEQIIRNKKDRMFLRVAMNSTEKVLVSHDYTDYQQKKRLRIRRHLSIAIVDASDVLNVL